MIHHTEKDGGKTLESNDYQFRYTTIKTLAMLRQSLAEQEQQLTELIEEANEAKGDQDTNLYRSAKKRLRLGLLNKKLLEEMMERLEISLQLDAMDRMIGSYNSCMEMMGERDLFATEKRGSLLRKEDSKKDLGRAMQGYTRFYENLINHQREDETAVLEDIITDEMLEEILSARGKIFLSDVIDDKLEVVRRAMEGV